MTAQELRKKYIDFFVSKGHKEIKTAPLIPENDPTVLFTTAGMHPLVPFLLGEKHPMGVRLVNCQKCVRTGDIDEVGDDTHLTFFEMLGNWSLGDYFKEETIQWSWEFLTDPKWLGLDPKKLAVTVFAGDKDAPFDEEAYKIWNEKVRVPAERIAKLSKKDNWWGPAGETGPCGPDTEMFYWVGDEEAPEKFDPEDQRWVEIWNDVFMQYNKTKEGNYEPLKQKNVDTGMGLERTLNVLQGKKTVYDTELFAGIIGKIMELAKEENHRSIRIIADHIRTAVFMAADGVRPLNIGQGYVMRRLIRRSIRHGKKLKIEGDFVGKIAKVVIDDFKDSYTELEEKREEVIKALEEEEVRFNKTLDQGLKEFEKIVDQIKQNQAFDSTQSLRGKKISGRLAFKLYDTYGFPIEMTSDLAEESGMTVDLEGFEKAFEKHRELARAGAEKAFKGGLADDSEQTKCLHSATHLLHQALRDVLGDHVQQKGSNITAERLRFDFTHPEKMTPEQIAEVEKIVNEKIKENLEIKIEEVSLEEAKKRGALALFADKYGEKVKLYSVGDYSVEVCGGPHAESTGELKSFKIKKEQSSSAGIRRIKAVVGA
ncbi:MAG TPA: alanine--tRNA ligase [Candidatus Peregrinibacteria bacterium]|nr:alanine--tRNA ligase [Candidatus Peregrinibacteria bacterium]